MTLIEELRQMPVVTVEQVIRFRDAAIAAVTKREQQILALNKKAGYCVKVFAPDLTCVGCEARCEHEPEQWPT